MFLILPAACLPSPEAPDPVVDAAADSVDSDEPLDTAASSTELPLELVSLGVGGVAMRHGDTIVLTAPLFSNPSLLDVTLGEVASDPALVDAFLDPSDVEDAAAVLVGHAHYDHLMDLPRVRELAGGPPVYANLSASLLLPDEGIVPVNVGDLVDRRMCDEVDPCTGLPAGQAGQWIGGEGFRLRALCSTHPAQFLGIVHFGEGCVDEAWSSPPTRAEDWREGATLAWLVDFLDDEGRIAHRVYYQDAPTNAPEGLIHPSLLEERRVDLAVLNVGSWEVVADHPGQTLANVDPRYLLGVHWEDFFQPQDAGIQPIPFQQDPAGFDARVVLEGEEAPVRVDGVEVEGRYWRPEPGARFRFPEQAATPVAAEGPEGSLEDWVLRADVSPRIEDCPSCEDLDADGLVDAWEDLALELLRPTLRFDEAEPYVLDEEAALFAVGRVTPLDDHVRVYLMLGYSQDYGRCGLTAHAGDSERVALDLALEGDDARVVALYTAAHEGTVSDHGAVHLPEEVELLDGRWLVRASDGKHASYATAEACETAVLGVCIDEDCDPDGVSDPAAYDRLPPVANAGEPDAPRLEGLGPIGFVGDEAWLDQDFCGGQDRSGDCSSPVLEKLTLDPF